MIEAIVQSRPLGIEQIGQLKGPKDTSAAAYGRPHRNQYWKRQRITKIKGLRF